MIGEANTTTTLPADPKRQLCPNCGRDPIHTVTRWMPRSQTIARSTYVCAGEHMWIVEWIV